MTSLVLPAGHGQPPLAVPGVYLKVAGGGEGLSARPLAPTGSFPLTHGSPKPRGCEWPRLARRRTRGCAVTCGCGHGSGPGGLPSLLFVRAISALAHPRGRGGTQGQQQAGPVSQPGFLPLLGTPSGDSVSRFRRRPGRCPNPCT